MPARPTRALVFASLAVLAVAAAIRGQRLFEGLPEFLDEATPLRRAIQMWRPDGTVDWNPHFFIYPSLSFYFHLALQWMQYQIGSAQGHFHGIADFLLAFETNPTSQVVVARLATIVVDLAMVLGTIVLGERLARGAGIAAGLVLAIAPTGIETSRALYVEAQLAALAVWAIERMVAHQRRGGLGSLFAAAVLIGLATGDKYPGVLLVVPLAWSVWTADFEKPLVAPARRFLRLGAALAVAAGSFFIASPFVLLDPGARTDLRFVADLAERGHLGHLGQGSASFYLERLARDPGLLVLGFFLLAPFLVGREGRRPLTLLILAIVPLLATVSVSSVIAVRYLVSIVPPLTVAAALGSRALVQRAPRFGRHAGLAAGLLLVGSVAPTSLAEMARPSGDTRLRALAWCRAKLPLDALVFDENGGPPLPADQQMRLVTSSWVFADASPEARWQYSMRRTFNAVIWPLFVHGDLVASMLPAGKPGLVVPVVAEAVEFNAVFYDLRLLALADYVITSSVVRSRFEADSIRFRPEVEAYRALDRSASIVAAFRPDRGQAGPEIRIYRIDETARERLRSGRALPDDWWLDRVARELGTPGSAGIDPGLRRVILENFHDEHVAPALIAVEQGLLLANRPDDAAMIERALAPWARRAP